MDATDTFSVDNFLGLPRVSGLALSPDGRRLVTTVASQDPEGQRYRSALHGLDPAGGAEPRRLTRSAPGESAPAFRADGSLLFLSARPDPDAEEEDGDEEPAGLWALPEQGEAELLAAPAGGVTQARAAARASTVVVATPLHPGTAEWDDDADHGKRRKESHVTAQLFEEYPLRFWDRWLGPRQPHLFAASDPQGPWVDLTPDPGFVFERTSFDVAADGATVVASRWRETEDPRDRATELVAIGFDGERAGAHTVIAADERVAYGAPACSPDSERVACLRAPLGSPDQPGDRTLVVVPIDGSEAPRDLLEGFDLWPEQPVWAPDGEAIYFTADDDGHCLPFRVDVGSGELTRLAADGAFDSLVCSPDGSALYAVRHGVDSTPRVVALDPSASDQRPRPIPTPGDDIEIPGTVERVETTAADGTRVPGWLVLPPGGDGPAPLTVFIHGGPLSSWNGWHWRWCPHVLAAQGWAVLLPDPALSTGYGIDYIARGWGRWGAEPYTDILALVDAVEAREDIDADRSAAMGGSFGGYMANWVAGHTDRFSAIVTHASLWNLESFHGTTDMGAFWEREFGDRYHEPERYREWSPHRFVDRISTPMLVIHGERDFRVPVSEGLTLWTDLRRHGVEAAYLHFPDENHWILSPQHARLWYECVIAFLDHHVLGKPWQPPELLR